MNRRILQAEERVRKARERCKEVIAEVQAKCKHPPEFVHEADWDPPNIAFGAQPPFMVCTKCGLAETGWGIGYHNLPRTNTKISRAEGIKYRRRMIDEEEKRTFKKQQGVTK